MAALVIAIGIGLEGSGAAVGDPAVTGYAPRSGEGAGAFTHAARLRPVRSRSEQCRSARRGLAFYRGRYAQHRARMGAGVAAHLGDGPRAACPRARFLAERWRDKAHAARRAYERWHEYHWNWQAWLPAKWQRIGACETGYGRRPGQWTWNSGTYQGAFGFYHGSWDSFVPRADRKAGPYPSEAYNATPRQQYEVALAIWRAYGFSGWGCRGA